MNEDELYVLIHELFENGVPIVFKGALALNSVFYSEGIDNMRKTRDIDANWFGNLPSTEEMRLQIEEAVKNIDSSYTVSTKRTYGENRSAGFILYDSNERPLVTIDIDTKPALRTQMYQFFGLSFPGVSIETMLFDKICSLSSPQILRRGKDLFDTYLLTSFIKYNTEELLDIAEESKERIHDFSTLKGRKPDLEYAYGKLKGIKDKPDFQLFMTEIYPSVQIF